ncbi:MAG: hypothetical protein K6F47_02180 [Bacteroidaceae bacterium]|nr:hypothetical protein [Bacteroidaceae bacterium]
MKKIYKTPRILVVQIRTNHMLAESIYTDGSQTISTESDGGWTKEYNNNSLNRNVWDEEW